jgi:pyruvate dehydrogenase E1 component beta subunit
MFGGNSSCPATFRAIINRGGEQGAQHSQSLQSWFAHIPGLKVVMPYSPLDARNLLISSVLSNDPVMFIEDRWLYENEEIYSEIELLDLNQVKPALIKTGKDLTLVGAGYATHVNEKVRTILEKDYGVTSDIIDVRLLNPFHVNDIVSSVNKTGRLVVVDGDWANCGFASEIVTSVVEKIEPFKLKNKPMRFTLPDAPAPTSCVLENEYYLDPNKIALKIMSTLERS